jgi:predicted acyl esterase
VLPRRSPILLLLALLLALVAAGSAAPAHAAALDVQGGIRFVAVRGATPGEELVLRAPGGQEAGRGTADAFGSLIFPELDPGAGYSVHEGDAADGTPVTVLSFDDTPDPSLYTGQSLHEGYQYIRTRDGTLLAAMVRAPLGKTLAQGPFPTVVEYSGYSTADPDSPQPTSQLINALGYATVGVNMRGSGCSGGVIDLFDLPTTADGYDVIETVAAQPWVQFGKVGMVGISFSGISQTFVGGSRPPHLAAVTPLSTIGDIYRAPGFPGGIFNNGFAQDWLQERGDDAQPAPTGGQAYAKKRVQNGDAICADNQRLRLQTQDPVAVTKAYPFYVPELMANRSPATWVGRITVPTFLAGSWQDEQTGGDFVSMLSRLPNRRDVKITLTNGVHTSPFDPQILWNWFAFNEIYVAHRVPDPTFLAAIASIVYGSIFEAGAPVPPLPANRFAGITSVDAARALFEADPHVRILMENGAGSAVPGSPAPTFALGFPQWPPRQLRATAWYLSADGALVPHRPGRRDQGVDAFQPDPSARPRVTLGNSNDWATLPPFDWEPLVDGTAVAWATPPLDHDVTIVGPSSLDLWLRSSNVDTDLQATLTEIRPDGKEFYVQNGWLRVSHRHLDRKRSTRLAPWPTHLEADAAPLPGGSFTKVRLPLFNVAHVFRAGSRIRISLEAPGGDRTRWAFDTPATGGSVLDEIARSHTQPSRLVLPVVPGVLPPAAFPPCPSLRGQPCRTYLPLGGPT